MIDQQTLVHLKALWKNASKPPMVIAPLGTSRQLVQISTLKPGALEVAKFVTDPAEPEKVAVCSAMDNAKFILAIWTHARDLLLDYEEMGSQCAVMNAELAKIARVSGWPGDGTRNLVDHVAHRLGYTPPQDDSAADPVAGVSGARPQSRPRVQRHPRGSPSD